MLKTKYTRNINKSSLIILPEKDCEAEKDSIEMFHFNQIPYFLKMEAQKKNITRQFCYDITGRRSLAQLLEYKSLNYLMLQKILSSFDQACIQVEDFMMTENDILLDAEFVFADSNAEEMNYCYLPGNQVDICGQFKEFMEYLLKNLDHKDEQAVQYAYSIYQRVVEEKTALHHVLRDELQIVSRPAADSGYVYMNGKLSDGSQSRQNDTKYALHQLNYNSIEKEQTTYDPFEKNEQRTCDWFMKKGKTTYDPSADKEQPTYDQLVKKEQPTYDQLVKKEQPTYDQLVKKEQPSYDQLVLKEQTTYNHFVKKEQPTYDPSAKKEQTTYDQLVKKEQPTYDPFAKKEQPTYHQLVKEEQTTYDPFINNQQPTYDPFINNQQPTYDPFMKNQQTFYDRGMKNEQTIYDRGMKNEQTIYDRSMKNEHVIYDQPVKKEESSNNKYMHKEESLTGQSAFTQSVEKEWMPYEQIPHGRNTTDCRKKSPDLYAQENNQTQVKQQKNEKMKKRKKLKNTDDANIADQNKEADLLQKDDQVSKIRQKESLRKQAAEKLKNMLRKKIYTDSSRYAEEDTVFEADAEEEMIHSNPTVCLMPETDEIQNRFIYQGADRSRDFHCMPGKMILGSDMQESDIYIPLPMVSRVHARVIIDTQGTFLEDMNSTNGTHVNGELLQYKERRMLQKGDIISLAGENYSFH